MNLIFQGAVLEGAWINYESSSNSFSDTFSENRSRLVKPLRRNRLLLRSSCDSTQKGYWERMQIYSLLTGFLLWMHPFCGHSCLHFRRPWKWLPTKRWDAVASCKVAKAPYTIICYCDDVGRWERPVFEQFCRYVAVFIKNHQFSRKDYELWDG